MVTVHSLRVRTITVSAFRLEKVHLYISLFCAIIKSGIGIEKKGESCQIKILLS